MNETDWEAAQELEQEWLGGSDASDTGPEPPPAPTAKEDPISVNVAWEQFIARAKNRNLSPTTVYKREQLKRQMCSFADRHGLRFL
jgi:hypothetical protein